MPTSKLSRLKSREDGFSNHALVSIVKLTVEANVVTSKHPEVFDVMILYDFLTLVQPLSVSYHS
jgi:hypothetical protein